MRASGAVPRGFLHPCARGLGLPTGEERDDEAEEENRDEVRLTPEFRENQKQFISNRMRSEPREDVSVYSGNMNTLLLIIVLLLLFGGGGFYIGGPAFGGGGLGLVLLICIIIYLMGGFRTKS